jgi:circadian clock protein KaiC
VHIESIASGVIQLDRVTPVFGPSRYHDIKLRTGGIEVYPRLTAAQHRHRFEPELLSSGLSELDGLLGGGLDRGTSVLISGPAGVGKSSLAMQFIIAAVQRRGRSVVYAFDERLQTLVQRCKGFGFDLDKACADGFVDLRQVDAAELTPGEFSHDVKRAVKQDGVKIVLLDSLNGYLHSMPEEGFLELHLHELIAYLSAHAVTSVLVHAQHGMLGTQLSSSVDVSYLADTSLVLRFFEFRGEVRQALSVHKRRSGPHERTIREMRLTSRGVVLGEPLRQFQGILSGEPVYLGGQLVDSNE